MRVGLYVGDGLGNIVHALPTIRAIKGLPHELTVSVLSTWDDAVRLVPHDKVLLRAILRPAEFDVIYASAKAPIEAGLRPPHSLQETSEVDANAWVARQLGFEGPMPEADPPRAAESPVQGDYVVIAPGYQKAGNNAWGHKAWPHWKALCDILSQVNSGDSAGGDT